MLQTNHGMSIPALVPPRFEEPSYGMNTSSSRPPPFSMCQPHASIPSPIVPSARVLQEVLYSNEMNYPSYMPDMPNNQSLPLPWMSSWHQMQNLPYLGHPHPGDYYPYPEFGEIDDSGIYPPKKKRARTTFSAEQLKRLEKRFIGNHYIVGEERQRIAKELELSEAQVKVWFQNRRIKFKRDEELEKLGKSKKRKGEHHVRKWQLTTRHFGPETDVLFHGDYDNTSRKHN